MLLSQALIFQILQKLSRVSPIIIMNIMLIMIMRLLLMTKLRKIYGMESFLAIKEIVVKKQQI